MPQECLPFGPHDCQPDGITHALDEQAVIVISVTESGKSAYIHMLATVPVALEKNHVPSKRVVSRDPVLVVCPPTGLEDDLIDIPNLYYYQ